MESQSLKHALSKSAVHFGLNFFHMVTLANICTDWYKQCCNRTCRVPWKRVVQVKIRLEPFNRSHKNLNKEITLLFLTYIALLLLTVEHLLTTTSVIWSSCYYGHAFLAARVNDHTFSCEKPLVYTVTR